ncbi:MAG: hypothetical protein HRT73_16310 [Flavobacteriales bacterium]|nr:hypothetical protein [Flavobacteriales bacterium]
MPDIMIELNPDIILKEFDFSIIKAIDKRASKDNVGYVSRGIGTNNTKVVLKDASTTYLENIIKKLLPKKENNSEIVLIIRNILISENIGTQNQYGYCNTEIEFARQVDTSLYSLGTFYASIFEKSNRVKYSHGKRLLRAFEDCFTQFYHSDWRNKDGTLIKFSTKESVFDYKALPPKGAYLNYNDMKRKVPFDTQDYKITLAKSSKKITSYKVEFKESVNSKIVQFISDGKNLYIRANQTQFIKSENYGKYIYFQGRIPTTYKNPNYGSHNATIISINGAGAAGAIIGITASIFFTALANDSYSNKELSTNYSIKGVVIDTDLGEVKFVTDMYLHRITKSYPGMLTEYRKSKRKLDDKRKVIELLNSKF